MAFPVREELDPRVIMCITIPLQLMQLPKLAAVIINAIHFHTEKQYIFYDTMSKKHKRFFKGLRFWDYDKISAPLEPAKPNVAIDEIAHYNRRILRFGKARAGQGKEPLLLFANNQIPTLQDFEEGYKVQKCLNVIYHAFETSPPFRGIVTKKWNDAMGPEMNYMADFNFRFQHENGLLDCFAIPRVWTDVGICKRGMNEEEFGEEKRQECNSENESSDGD